MALIWLKWAAIAVGGWLALSVIALTAFSLVVGHGKRREERARQRRLVMREFREMARSGLPPRASAGAQLVARTMTESDPGDQQTWHMPVGKVR